MFSSKKRLQKIIFGNLSLLGISYQGRKKDKEYAKKFSNKDEMKKVIKVAIKYKLKFFAASSQDFNKLSPVYLNAIKEIEKEDEVETLLITCIGIPLEFRGKNINDYKRWKTHLNYESKEFGQKVEENFFEDPILNFRFRWKENLRRVKPYKLKELGKELKINWRLWEKRIDTFSRHTIAWVEPGSEVDFLTISRIDLLEELIDKIRELGYSVLLGSHHLGASAPLIQENRMKGYDGYVTPVNKLGVMMFPTKEDAETALINVRKRGKIIIGIKPFAGGRIKPIEALNYVYKEQRVDSCMLGVGSVAEAEDDFQAAQKILMNIR